MSIKHFTLEEHSRHGSMEVEVKPLVWCFVVGNVQPHAVTPDPWQRRFYLNCIKWTLNVGITLSPLCEQATATSAMAAIIGQVEIGTDDLASSSLT